jgi:hypothetical protein
MDQNSVDYKRVKFSEQDDSALGRGIRQSQNASRALWMQGDKRSV